MGYSTTPTYRVEMSTPGYFISAAPWRVKGYGRIRGSGKPTTENLERYIREFELSTQGEGVNKHLGATKITRARIIRQADGEVMATYENNGEAHWGEHAKPGAVIVNG